MALTRNCATYMWTRPVDITHPAHVIYAIKLSKQDIREQLKTDRNQLNSHNKAAILHFVNITNKFCHKSFANRFMSQTMLASFVRSLLNRSRKIYRSTWTAVLVQSALNKTECCILRECISLSVERTLSSWMQCLWTHLMKLRCQNGFYGLAITKPSEWRRHVAKTFAEYRVERNLRESKKNHSDGDNVDAK